MESALSRGANSDVSRVGLNHVVQFYETESFLCDAVGDFLHAGAEAGAGR
jgi:hypothetical protein